MSSSSVSSSSSASSISTTDTNSSSSASSASTTDATPVVLTEDDHREVLECARYGEADDLKELLKLGGNVNYLDDNGNSALHKAAANGTIDIANILYEYNAQYLANLSGNTPLHFACLMGHKPMVEWLLNHYGTIIDIYSKNHFNRSPFTEAINSGHEEIARLLLNHNSADVPKGFGAANASSSSASDSGNTATFTEEEDDVNDEDADLLEEASVDVVQENIQNLNIQENNSNTVSSSNGSNAAATNTSTENSRNTTDNTER